VASFGQRPSSHSNFLPVSIEIEEYFDHLLCWRIATLLVTSRGQHLEDEVFQQNHVTYEKFVLKEKLPSRNEISREAEAAYGKPFPPGTKRSVWEILQLRNLVGAGHCSLITESGNLGLGPISTESGDVVAFIRSSFSYTISCRPHKVQLSFIIGHSLPSIKPCQYSQSIGLASISA